MNNEIRTAGNSPLRKVAVGQEFITTYAARSLVLVVDIIYRRRQHLSNRHAQGLTILVHPSRVVDNRKH